MIPQRFAVTFLNRSAVLLTPKSPFVKWVTRDDPEHLGADWIDGFRDDPLLLLLPTWKGAHGLRDVIDSFWPLMFEAMLESWDADEAQWPTDRTRALFDEWFEWRRFSVLRDVYRERPLALEELSN